MKARGGKMLKPVACRTSSPTAPRPAWVRVAIAAVAAAALAIPAFAGASAFPGTNGRIVFAQEIGTGPNGPTTESIVTANPDGSSQKQLTSGHVDSDPRFSADGKFIVFNRGGFASSVGGFTTAEHVMLMHSDGTGITDLSTSDAGTPFSDNSPSFSPDGTQIAFGRIDLSTGNERGIFLMPVTGGPAVQITTAHDSRPTFSPDGTKIAFERQINSMTQAIFTVPPVILAGATQVTHPASGSFDNSPDWSPNGAKIAFVRDVNSILVTNADGSGTPTTLQTTHGDDEGPAYSPDGTKIIFASTGDTFRVGPGGSPAFGLFTMNATNGSGVTAVPGLGGGSTSSNMNPDWGTASVTTTPPPTSGCGSTNEPDRNGDLHSNCHTGAKGQGAGGNDKSSTTARKRT
jgi:Tol biopolymer transport system component